MSCHLIWPAGTLSVQHYPLEQLVEHPRWFNQLLFSLSNVLIRALSLSSGSHIVQCTPILLSIHVIFGLFLSRLEMILMIRHSYMQLFLKQSGYVLWNYSSLHVLLNMSLKLFGCILNWICSFFYELCCTSSSQELFFFSSSYGNYTSI